MKQVTKEEGEISLVRWNNWVKRNEVLRANEDFRTRFLKSRYSNKSNKEASYPLEPVGFNLTLGDYNNNLKEGLIFYTALYYNEKTDYKIVDYYYNESKKLLAVATATKGGIKSFYYTEIRRENDRFVYETRSFFDPTSVDKAMTLARGLTWNGGNTIDDYC